jgi:phage terminase small subunit
MGRPAKSQRQKELEGNPGKRKIQQEIEIELASLRAPSILNKQAKGYWKEYAPLLRKIGSLTRLNVPTFIEYCRIRARLDQIHGMVDLHPSMLEETKWIDSSGQENIKFKEAEYFKMVRKLSGDSLKYEKALKMTPDKMAGVYKPAPDTTPEEDFLQ